MSKNDLNSKDFLIGTLVGSMVGAAAALMLAPKAGKDLRIDISQKATEVKDKTSQLTNSALERSSNIANYAKEKTSNLSQVVSEQSSQIMEKVRNLKGSQAGQAEIAETEIENTLQDISSDNKEEQDNQEGIELRQQEEVTNSVN